MAERKFLAELTADIVVAHVSNNTVSQGDVATLIGGGHDAIHPNEVAIRSATSTYDRFMHLGAGLRRLLI